MAKTTEKDIDIIIKEKNFKLISIYQGEHNKEVRVIFKDEFGFFYDKAVSSLSAFQGKRSMVSCSNKYTLINIETWLKNNKRNFYMTDNIYIDSFTPINFFCNTCNSSFSSSWNSIQNGQKCPFCSGNRVNETNSLAFKYPELSKEWNYERNNGLTPFDFTPGSGKKAWWICERGHEWESVIGSRARNGTNCPTCNISKGELKISKVLESLSCYYLRNHKFKDCKNKEHLPFDFYLPKDNICIEYQGEQHYIPIEYFKGEKGLREMKQRDKIKKKYCKDNNIKLIVIPYKKYKQIEEILLGELCL